MSHQEPIVAKRLATRPNTEHAIDRMLPAPRHAIGPGEHIDIFAQAVGPLGGVRGAHGFGMIIRTRSGLELGTFGYRSLKPDTTGNRGYFGSLISALAWRQLHAPSNPTSIKTTLSYIYEHFKNHAERWIAAGMTASRTPVKNLVLVKAAFGLWKEQHPEAELMRPVGSDQRDAERAKAIASNMRDYGSETAITMPEEHDDFDAVEEDIEELIERALYKEARREEQLATHS